MGKPGSKMKLLPVLVGLSRGSDGVSSIEMSRSEFPNSRDCGFVNGVAGQITDDFELGDGESCIFRVQPDHPGQVQLTLLEEEGFLPTCDVEDVTLVSRLSKKKSPKPMERSTWSTLKPVKVVCQMAMDSNSNSNFHLNGNSFQVVVNQVNTKKVIPIMSSHMFQQRNHTKKQHTNQHQNQHTRQKQPNTLPRHTPHQSQKHTLQPSIRRSQHTSQKLILLKSTKLNQHTNQHINQQHTRP